MPFNKITVTLLSAAALITGSSAVAADFPEKPIRIIVPFAAGTATVDGQSRRVLGSWWQLVPGSNSIAFSGDGYDAAAALAISFRSAWK